ncbi:MAG: globin [Proteobacteria bacterium]|nr:globin [Pseudomonadota bacterium]
MTQAIDAALIEKSFEIAAGRSADITPLVYAKLFAQCPEMEALFVRDTTGAIRGEMLFRVIDSIFDFLGPGSYAANFIQCEVVTHEGYGVPREMFGTFFGALAETLKDLAGSGWSPAMDEAWRGFLDELATFSSPLQNATAA